MLDYVIWTAWFLFGGYCFWFFTMAKRSEPLTLDDLVIVWKVHKQQSGCGAPISRLKPIMHDHSDEFSGFRCECGYQYLSKRLITQRRVIERNMFVPASSGVLPRRSVSRK
jgi:hypothetical protein